MKEELVTFTYKKKVVSLTCLNSHVTWVKKIQREKRGFCPRNQVYKWKKVLICTNKDILGAAKPQIVALKTRRCGFSKHRLEFKNQDHQLCSFRQRFRNQQQHQCTSVIFSNSHKTRVPPTESFNITLKSQLVTKPSLNLKSKRC